MKNKVLVAMGIGVAAAMVPAVASTAEVIDLENLTQEQIDTIEKIEEAEATNENEEVKLNPDDDFDDFAEIHLVPDAAPIQEGSLSVGSDDKENPVHYADVVFTDNEEEVIHELTPAASPSAIPTQAPVRPVITASPVPSSTPMVTEVPMPSTAPVAEAASVAVAANSGGLVIMNPSVDMDASKKAELKAEELKNAGFEDVNINKEEEYRLPGSMGIGGDDKPKLTKDQLVNALIMMKNVMGGFEDLTPYSDDDLKAMDDDELMALNDKFKNIQIFQAVENPEVKDTDEKVILSGSFKNKEDRDSALVDLREAGYAPFKNMSDEQIAALSDEQLTAMGISATTEEYESEISVEEATGLTKAQLAEKLEALAGNAENEDDPGYDVLTPANIRAALQLGDDDQIPAFKDMTDEQLLALSSKLGITRTTAPIDPTKTQDISDVTRDALFTKLGQLKRDGYDGLADVNLFAWINLSDDDLIAEINKIEGLSDAKYEVLPLVEKLKTDRLHKNSHNDGAEYVKITLTYANGTTENQYLKVSKVGTTITDKDGKEYVVGTKGLVTETLNNVGKSSYQVGGIYYDKDGNQFVITKITKVQNAVKKGDKITQDEYDKLTDAEKDNYKYLGNYVWITKIVNGQEAGTIAERLIPENSKISIDKIEEYSVIALNSYTGGGSVNGKVYTGDDDNTDKYFNQYYAMLLETQDKSDSYNTAPDINNGKNDTMIRKFSNGPEYTESHNPSAYTTPIYYVTSTSKVATIDLDTDNKSTAGNIIDAVFVVAKGIEKVIVNGINGVVIAPEADVYLANSGDKTATLTGVVVGNNVINDGTYYAKEEKTKSVKVKDGYRQYYDKKYNNRTHQYERKPVNYRTNDYEDIPAQYEDRGTGEFEYREKEGTALTLNTGKIDIVGREVKKYEAKESKSEVYDAEKTSYVVNASRKEFDVTVADQVSVFSLAPETQDAKYTYGFTAPEQKATYRYGVKGDEVFYKYTVSGHRTTTTSYYGEAVVTAPPVAPPPTPDVDIITETFVFGAPADVTDDFVAAPVAAVLGANRPVEVEGTVLGAQRSGSVLGERRGPQGAVLGKRRSPKTADAAMGGMIAGMMLSMMTAFGGATVLKKKREDEE